jgi:hypothetical protein
MELLLSCFASSEEGQLILTTISELLKISLAEAIEAPAYL